MKRTLSVVILSLFLSSALAMAQTQAGTQDGKNNDQERTSGPGIGTKAPDFELQLLNGNGKTMKLSSLKGKAVIVNFWATWCQPCKIEMPWLIQLQRKYGRQGLRIVGVNMDDADENTISAFSKKMGVNYPVLIGTEKVADSYGGLDGLPISFFLDRSGKVVNHILGLVSESEIEHSIQKSLSQGGQPPASGQ